MFSPICKTLFLSLLWQFSISNAFGQHSILEKYDFTKGGYCIFKVPHDFASRPDAPVAYFNDIPTLLRLQRELSFSEKPSENRIRVCPTESYLYICRNGELAEMFTISTACNQISHAPKYYSYDGYFPFEGYKLSKVKHETFPDLASARKRWQELKAPSNALYITNVLWDRYEGQFSFYIPVKDDTEKGGLDYYYENLLKSKFPNERITCIGKTYPNNPLEGGKRHLITVWCNKSLFDKFDLFPLEDPGWKYFKLEVTSYWPQ
jgi:hypothetical protein